MNIWTKDNIKECKALKEHDHVTFIVGNSKLNYKVALSHPREIFLSLSANNNDLIFTILGLDAHQFCKQFYKNKKISGMWPVAESFEELTIVVKALFNEIKVVKDWCWNSDFDHYFHKTDPNYILEHVNLFSKPPKVFSLRKGPKGPRRAEILLYGNIKNVMLLADNYMKEVSLV